MSDPSRSGGLSRYLASVVEQGLWSLLQLGLNLVLIRIVAPAEYGGFVFWANCAFVLASLQNALSVTHLLVLPAGPGDDPARLPVERLMTAVSAAFWLLLGLATALAVMALSRQGGSMAAPAAALFLPAFTAQQYVRALYFSRGRPVDAALQTGAVLLLAGLLIGALAWTQPVLKANGVLLALAAAYGLVAAGGLVRATRGQWRGVGWSDFRGYLGYVRQTAWIFLGVATTEVLARFYAFAVAATHGPAAIAALSAAQLLLRPVPLLATSWSMVARTDMVRRREAGDRRGMAAMVWIAVAGGAILAGLWTAALFEAWPLVSRYLFGGKYAGEAWLVPLWGLASALSFGQTAVSVGLQVLRAFKALALANTAAAIMAVCAMLILLRQPGYGGAVIATAFGQGLELVLMAAVLMVLLGRPSAASAARPPPPRTG